MEFSLRKIMDSLTWEEVATKGRHKVKMDMVVFNIKPISPFANSFSYLKAARRVKIAQCFTHRKKISTLGANNTWEVEVLPQVAFSTEEVDSKDRLLLQALAHPEVVVMVASLIKSHLADTVLPANLKILLALLLIPIKSSSSNILVVSRHNISSLVNILCKPKSLKINLMLAQTNLAGFFLREVAVKRSSALSFIN
jgi:hypothetical protein